MTDEDHGELQYEDMPDEPENAPEDQYRYEVIIDMGKPYTEGADSLEEVREILKKFYLEHIKGNEETLPHIDMKVFEGYSDISETQAIEMIAGEIVKEAETNDQEAEETE